MSAAIKVVRFLAGDPSLAEVLSARWTGALAADADADADADAGGPAVAGRPVRVALAVAVELPEIDAPRFAAVDLQWFPDVGEALANEAWLAAVDPDLALDSPLLGGASCRIVAEEVVLRGHDQLAARWAAGGERHKMMSFGRRHPTLTPEEFSARWRGEAGRLGGERIPDDVRGSAYVQNHPVRSAGHEWPLDAVNEVYLDDLAALRRRAAWLAARLAAGGPAGPGGLMSPTEAWSMGLREAVLTPPAALARSEN